MCALVFQIRCDISNLRGVFDKIKEQSRSVYTPDEDSQHFSRFKDELEEVNLHEDVSIEYLTEFFNNTKPALLQSMVDKINSMQQSWTASKDQPPFKGTS
ncbi:hypothetical protein Pmar_PMAR026390 [Perkinsus marinus ATCC 50983]|uniref:Uncharacterized protein n=1 Tax=Perkinsus marinus (strain ATCC 50983 / TXsc) TaxID=423536 RepID=C5LEM0_PERM5|nr:hypothetical protein Pmar_PMAR026390 [Perkinsus marinus ATCC 50983]EER04838.1 hypothetical protein Pmar_PMAR026390 [Perkinsus marinus ATCC 50983]|eukprot:XP_002773022.1 hypothetical protein Pmar_PMAR026390 [Perkinsus marinus ATCC 50983]